MGSTSFFSKFAATDPIAQALGVPGANKYKQAQAQAAAGQTDTNGGPYTGIAPTLAAANAGYRPGGPGAPVGWAPTQPSAPSGIMNLMEKNANFSGNVNAPARNAWSSNPTLTGTFGTGNPYPIQQNAVQSPYVLAAGNAARQSSTGGPY